MRTLSEEHKVIWLEPSCGEDNSEGRQWCQDNVWGDKCDDCEAKPVKYIRADLVEELRGELQKAKDKEAAIFAMLRDPASQ